MEVYNILLDHLKDKEMMDDLIKKNRTFTDELDLTEKEVMLQHEVEF